MYNYFKEESCDNVESIISSKYFLDPTIRVLEEAYIYEIRQIAYYLLKTKDLSLNNTEILNIIVRVLASTNLCFEYRDKDIQDLLKYLRKKRIEVIEHYTNYCNDNNIECQFINLLNVPKDEDINIITAIQEGEKQSLSKNTQLSNTKRNLYEIIVILAKVSAIMLSKLDDYNINTEKEKYTLLALINCLNFAHYDEDKLIKRMNTFIEEQYNLTKKLYDFYEKKFDKIKQRNVNLTRLEGKCILVSGDNLYNLELLLKATKDTDIKIYTHDRMILAFSYPYFQKYKNLVGHYQRLPNNFVLDFAKFPGPVLLTKDFIGKFNSLFRGRIFSTEIITGKGMTPIKNYDFLQLIECADKMSGFTHERDIPSVKVGYNFKTIRNKIEKIADLYNQGIIKHIDIIGLYNHHLEIESFLKTFIKKLSEKDFVISLSCNMKGKNIYHINAYYNFNLTYKMIEILKKEIKQEKLPISVYITQCNIYTVSNIMILNHLGINDITLCCTSLNGLNPPIINYLVEKFNIKILAATT